MDWDNIDYIFQIPVSWYKDVDVKLNKAYGNNLVYVKEGIQGGLEVGIDYDAFHDAVKQIASETSAGTVSKVDGIPPDATGNVNFGLTPNRWLVADGNGHITTTNQYPLVIDDLEEGFPYCAYGDLSYVPFGTDQYTVAEGNHDHGNITNDGKLSGCAATSCLVVTDTTGKITHSDGILSEISYAGSDLATLQNLVSAFTWNHETGKPNIYNIKSVDGVQAQTDGNVPLKAVRHITGQSDPDNDGVVTLTGYVKSVNNILPDANGNVSVELGDGKVKSVDGVEPDDNGNVPLHAVKSVNHTMPDSSGNVQITVTSPVTSVDGKTGDVVLTGDYAPIVHEHEHTDITDWGTATADFVETINVADAGITAGFDWDDPDQYVCPTNHGHKSSDIVDLEENGLSNVVKLTGDQTVAGEKTFTNDIIVYENGRSSRLTEEAVTIGGNSILTFENDPNFYVENQPNVPQTDLSSKVLATCGYVNSNTSSYVTLSTEQTITAMKTFTSGITVPTGSGVFVTDSNKNLIGGIVENDGAMGIESSSGKDIVLASTSPNAVQLLTQPTDTSTTSKAVATCGYVNDKFVTLDTDQTITGSKTITAGKALWFGTSSGYIWQQTGNNPLTMMGSTTGGILLNGRTANAVKLGQQPTDTSTTSLAVATVGYVQSHQGTVKKVQGVSPDSSGNVVLTNVFANKSHTHPHTDISDWATATMPFIETTDVASDGVVAGMTYSGSQYVCPTKHKHMHTDIQDWSDTTKVFARSLNRLTPDDYGNIQLPVWDGYVHVDAQGNIEQPTKRVIDLDYSSEPQTTSIRIMTAVTWNGSQLKAQYRSMDFVNGVLTNVSDPFEQVIDTAVTYNPS